MIKKILNSETNTPPLKGKQLKIRKQQMQLKSQLNGKKHKQ